MYKIEVLTDINYDREWILEENIVINGVKVASYKDNSNDEIIEALNRVLKFVGIDFKNVEYKEMEVDGFFGKTIEECLVIDKNVFDNLKKIPLVNILDEYCVDYSLKQYEKVGEDWVIYSTIRSDDEY